MQGPYFLLRKCNYTFHSAYFLAKLGTVVMNVIEVRIPNVDFFVILNIPVALDSGCHGNQDRKCHEMYIFLSLTTVSPVRTILNLPNVILMK